jgi:trimethylamine-N-oxide reductase (cytochrome c)
VKSLNFAKRAAALKGATLGALSEGERLFYGRCTLCHIAREPGDFTMNQWLSITESMFPRAGLNEAERAEVLKFLSQNAKGAVPM